MGEVADRAGASKATLYKLFADMEALFAAAMTREVERRRAGISHALTAPTTARALDAAARAMLVALDERAVELFRLAIAEAGRHPELGRGFHRELVETAARPIGERLARDLDLDADRAHGLALQFVGAIKEPLFYPRLMGASVVGSPDAVVELAVRMVLSGTCRPARR